jgi:hypothetical protein
LLATLPLGRRLDILDGRQRAILSGQQHHPHVSAIVINKQEKIAIPAWCYQRDGAANIPVYKLQRLRRPPESLMWEWRPSVLAGKAHLTNLVHLGQDGEAAHQPLSPHLPQRLKIDVAELSMPPPGIFSHARRQADWPCNGDVEHV